MHIIVCVKQVVAAERAALDPRTHSVIRTPEASYLNPYDLYALEMAKRLRTQYSGRITVISMGPPMSEAVLRDALALGVDEAVLLSDRRFAAADTLATSYVLGMGVRKVGAFDLILCGLKTTDSDTQQVGPQLAEELSLPSVMGVEKISWDGEKFQVERVSDGFREVWAVNGPALFSVARGAVETQLPSLSGIQAAFKADRPLTIWNLDSLNAAEEMAGLPGSGTWVTGLTPVSASKQCEFISGEVREQAKTLFNKLLEKNLIG